MINYSDLWPPYGLIIRAGDLQLSPITDDDLPGLIELAQSGIHDPAWMPFEVPWTLAPPEELPRRYAQHYWETRARFAPDHFTLDFAVRHGAQLVGVQGFVARDYSVLRSAETGSWLASKYQGHGLGTKMRQAICTFLFDHLEAIEITSAAFDDNHPSRAVSRKVGYRANGTLRKNRQGQPAVSQRLVLEPSDLVRGDPIEVDGAEPLREYLGIDR